MPVKLNRWSNSRLKVTFREPPSIKIEAVAWLKILKIEKNPDRVLVQHQVGNEDVREDWLRQYDLMKLNIDVDVDKDVHSRKV